MAVNGGPKIPTDGLVLNLDFANFKSNRGRRGLINWNEWTSGSGGTTSYVQNGTTEENRRIWDTNPFGNTDIVWDSPTNDTGLNGDGGWNYNYIPIDPTKMYRHSVWIRRPTIGNGSTYLGTYGFTDTTNTGVLYRSTGGSTTNAYFISTGWWGAANAWYLITGHTWPYGSGTGAAHVDSGIYAPNGTKVANSADFVWKTLTTNKTSHRSYLFYSSNTSTNQQWYQPRIDLCDGTEPTIEELLNDAGNKITDISYNGNDGLITGSMAIDSDNLGSYEFDGVNDKVNFYFSNSNVRCYNSSVIFIVKLPTWSGGQKCILSYRGGSGGQLYIGKKSDGIFSFYNSLQSGGAYAAGTTHTSTGDFNDNSVVFGAVVMDADSGLFKTYVNGKKIGEVVRDSGWSSSYNTVLNLGYDAGGTNEYMTGNFYYFAHYDKVLSDEEIKTLYNSKRGRFGL